MEKQLIEMQAANLLLERGIRFKIKDAPFFIKLLRLNRLTIAALKAGTIARYSLIIYSKQLHVRISDVEYLYAEIDSVCEVIAIAILNHPIKIKLLYKTFARLLKWKIPYTELIKIFISIVEINKAVDFTTITSFLLNQMKRLMSPKLGQEEGS